MDHYHDGQSGSRSDWSAIEPARMEIRLVIGSSPIDSFVGSPADATSVCCEMAQVAAFVSSSRYLKLASARLHDKQQARVGIVCFTIIIVGGVAIIIIIACNAATASLQNLYSPPYKPLALLEGRKFAISPWLGQRPLIPTLTVC